MSWNKDASGLSHYVFSTLGHVSVAIEDALATRPTTPSWFWFNGTPCPMLDGDDAAAVGRRWSEWRAAYQQGDLILMLQGTRGTNR
jgi:hypothetical protein